MKSQKLTIRIKNKIENNIKKDVTATVLKSPQGKEIEKIKNKLVNFVQEKFTDYCSDEELKTLSKFNCTEQISRLYFVISSDDEIKEPWTHNGKVFSLFFDPCLVVHSIFNQREGKIAQWINNSPVMKELAIEAIKYHNHLSCEIEETIKALLEVVNQFNTTKQIVDNYPYMKKYIPEQEDSKTQLSKRSSALVKEFLGKNKGE